MSCPGGAAISAWTKPLTYTVHPWCVHCACTLILNNLTFRKQFCKMFILDISMFFFQNEDLSIYEQRHMNLFQR